jgi:hypothetical protein
VFSEDEIPVGGAGAPTEGAAGSDGHKPGGRTLLAVVAILVAAYALSNVVLGNWPGFWSFARSRADGYGSMVARAEANIRLRPARRARMLFVGSSTVNRNIDLHVLADASPWDSDHLGLLWFPGATQLELAMFAPRLVEKQPDIVVILDSVWSLREDEPWQSLRHYDFSVASELLGWRGLLAGHALHADFALSSSHAVTRNRRAFRQVLFSRLGNSSSLGRKEAWTLLHGATAARARARRQARASEFACPSVHVDALELLARRLAAVGTRVAVVQSPTQLRWADSQRVQGEYKRCLGEAAERSGFTFIDKTMLPGFGADDFYDRVHLTPEARPRFSAALAEVLLASGVLPAGNR